MPIEVKNLINEERKWCIVKLSPLERFNNIDKLYELGFRQFHCCNSFPTLLGGLSGPILTPLVEEKIKYIKNKYKECQVIAGGGMQIEALNYYKKLGADHFSVSSIGFNPFRFGWFYPFHSFFYLTKINFFSKSFIASFIASSANIEQ